MLLVGHIYHAPPFGILTWIPDVGPDPSNGFSSQYFFMQENNNSIVDNITTHPGTVRLTFSGTVPAEPFYVYVTTEGGHTYAGTLVDPFPVYEDPTPDLLSLGTWEPFWGAWMSIGLGVYADISDNPDTLSPGQSSNLAPGMFGATGSTPAPTYLTETPGLDHQYSFLVDHRISQGAWIDFPVPEGTHHVLATGNAYRLDATAWPVPTWRTAGAVASAPWPYGTGVAQLEKAMGGAVQVARAVVGGASPAALIG